MKKIISIILALALIMSASAFAMPREYAITVYVDGEKIEFDVPPRAEFGRTLVPMRYIFEALGAEVRWIGEENRAIATKDDITIDLILGSDVMYRNDAPIKLDVPAKAVDGRTLVPARAVSEALDATVEWNADTYTVTITSSKPYVPGEYHYTELSDKDLDTFRKLYPSLYTLYAQEVLYENVSEYPEDVAELINAEDARIRMFADDVWNNLMAHTILNIQTESKDMYIFDIPEDVEMDPYSLMSDYLTLTESENMSSETTLETKFQKAGDNTILEIYFKGQKTIYGISDVDFVFVVPTENSLRYFYSVYPTDGDVTKSKVYEVTDEGSVVVDEINDIGMWKSGAKSHVQVIENVIKNEK